MSLQQAININYL